MRDQQTDRLPQRFGQVGRGIAETDRDIELDAGCDPAGAGMVQGMKASVEAPRSGTKACVSIVCGWP